MEGSSLPIIIKFMIIHAGFRVTLLSIRQLPAIHILTDIGFLGISRFPTP
jgi:hypothetical protein